MIQNQQKMFRRMLLAVLSAGSILFSVTLVGYSVPEQAHPTAATPAPATPTAPASRPSRYRVPMSSHARNYYSLIWGVDSFNVKLAESGEIVRFTWRVVDPAKAAPLSDKKAVPSLIDPKRSVKLEVPVMEKVGQLRQTTTPQEGRQYWMAFSNKGRPVKAGDRVTVSIGKFRVDGLLVE